jgi:ribonuclease D
LQTVVTTSEALAELGANLESREAIGLDTEFLRERTYRAELCLVQVSAGDGASCVDPIALSDLTPIARALTAQSTIKVMHASRQDLEVLLPVTGLVRPVFDTQIAAALTGLPAQVGYAELVRRLIGIDLAKSHTRTDWSRRPLSPEQIEYALDDVRYLLPLKSLLEEQIEKLGRMQWLKEEFAALDDSRSFSTEPEQAWQRIKGLRGLDDERLRLAQRLAAWRERRAIDRNRPRGWILDDSALREIAVHVPRTPQALSEISEVPAGVVKHCGEELLDCVRAAEIPDPPPPMPARIRPDPLKTALVKKLAALNQTIAADLSLSPEILATRRDLEQLVERGANLPANPSADGRQDIAVLKGWRRGVIGDRLLAAL